MFFASDNAGPAHPAVMQALIDANTGFAMPYGKDEIMAQLTQTLRDIFEAPEAAIYLVATGTAANSLALATLCQPFQTIMCSPVAHIHEDECNAPEFYSSGAKLTLVGTGDKISAEALRRAYLAEETRGVHGPQRGPVSITQVTERGQIYSLQELADLTAVAREFGQKAHLDGARFANALVALGCSPADMTWRAGIDVVSFGGTKNGCPGVEAVIFFNPEKAWEFELRRKRGAHLFSKHRYLSAQMAAYLADDLWLNSARKANANCARLLQGLKTVPGFHATPEPQANMIFAHMPRAAHKRLHDAGAVYYLLEGDCHSGPADTPLPCRLVCDWSISAAQIDQFIAIARG